MRKAVLSKQINAEKKNNNKERELSNVVPKIRNKRKIKQG